MSERLYAWCVSVCVTRDPVTMAQVVTAAGHNDTYEPCSDEAPTAKEVFDGTSLPHGWDDGTREPHLNALFQWYLHTYGI